jgi:hypothetical protein
MWAQDAPDLDACARPRPRRKPRVEHGQRLVGRNRCVEPISTPPPSSIGSHPASRGAPSAVAERGASVNTPATCRAWTTAYTSTRRRRTTMREPLGPQQQRALEQMRTVLGDDFITLEVRDYQLRESFDEEFCVVVCNVVEKPGDRRFSVEGKGVGMLDAFFSALCTRYQNEHPSLETIRFTHFDVRGLMGDARAERASDAKAEAHIGVTNSAGTEFTFTAVSTSVSHSSMEAVLEAVEYFVNSERAYVRIYKALEHYRKENRPDLVGKYTHLLAEMVRNTSYSTAVERLKKELR